MVVRHSAGLPIYSHVSDAPQQARRHGMAAAAFICILVRQKSRTYPKLFLPPRCTVYDISRRHTMVQAWTTACPGYKSREKVQKAHCKTIAT